MTERFSTKNMVTAAVFLALGMVLPFFTGQIPTIGSMLLPMHIPVLICGYVCGWQWGLLVGLIVPILRSMTLGMPPMMPVAAAMAFELAAYGASTGLLYEKLEKNTISIYISLIGAMIFGRIVWGLVSMRPLWNYGKCLFCADFFKRSPFKGSPGNYLADCPDSCYYYNIEKSKGNRIKYERNTACAFKTISPDAAPGCGKAAVSERIWRRPYDHQS